MSRPRTAAATSAAIVVAVALFRHHAELRVERRGRRGATWAATRALPRHRQGRLARATATWQPTRPDNAAGRLAANLWAAPLTAAGFLLAWAGRSRPRWHESAGAFVATDVGGPARVAGVDANAVGHVVLSRNARPSERLLIHEFAHVRQAERLGPLLPLVYTWWLARYGYRDHPLERSARRATRQALGLESDASDDTS